MAGRTAVFLFGCLALALLVLPSVDCKPTEHKSKVYAPDDPVVATLDIDVNKLLPAFLSKVIKKTNYIRVEMHVSDFEEVKSDGEIIPAELAKLVTVAPSPPPPPPFAKTTHLPKQTKPALSLMGNIPFRTEPPSYDEGLLKRVLTEIDSELHSRG